MIKIVIGDFSVLSKSEPYITFIVFSFKMLKTFFFLVGVGPLKRQGLRTKLR